MLKAKYLIILYQTQLLVHFVEVVLFGSHDDGSLHISLSNHKLVICLFYFLMMLGSLQFLIGQLKLSFKSLVKKVCTYL